MDTKKVIWIIIALSHIVILTGYFSAFLIFYLGGGLPYLLLIKYLSLSFVIVYPLYILTVFIIYFFIKYNLEKPLADVLEGEINAVLDCIMYHKAPYARTIPLKPLSTEFKKAIEDIFSVLKLWGELNKVMEELYSISIAADEKNNLIEKMAIILKDVFPIKDMAVLEFNHSMNKLEVIYGDIYNKESEIIFNPKMCNAISLEKDISHKVSNGCPFIKSDSINPISCFPLRGGGSSIGLIKVMWDLDRIKELSYPIGQTLDSYITFYYNIFNRISILIGLSMGYRNMLDNYKNSAITDPLTNLYNRRYLIENLNKLIKLSERIDKNLCVLMIDIDNFKMFNDEYGHSIGDRVLKIVSKVILDNVRAEDIVGRIGGEPPFMAIARTIF